MPGLLKPNDAAKVQGGGRGPTDPANTQGQQPNVSPEEQQAYDQFVNNAYSLIYDEKTMPVIEQRLKGNGDPVDGLAATTVLVVMRVEDSAKRAGREISPDVLMHGGAEILQDLADFAAMKKIHEYSPQEIEGATYRALDMYREIKTQRGELDTEGLKGEFAQLQQADQQGRLGEVLPGIEQAAKRGGA